MRNWQLLWYGRVFRRKVWLFYIRIKGFCFEFLMLYLINPGFLRDVKKMLLTLHTSSVFLALIKDTSKKIECIYLHKISTTIYNTGSRYSLFLGFFFDFLRHPGEHVKFSFTVNTMTNIISFYKYSVSERSFNRFSYGYFYKLVL